jgi:small subunit ribosomal protein S4
MLRHPKFKICRRLGPGVYDKCQTQKFVISEARKAKSRKKRPKALSDYGLQLLEKQKIRFSYGISERQFAKYIEKAMRSKGMAPSLKLLEKLESRLDNVVYRLGLAGTRLQARQMVSHGHFLVNNKKTKVPSHEVNPGDIIVIREGSKAKGMFQNIEKKLKNVQVPQWIKFDPTKLSAEIKGKPKEFDSLFDFNTVLEFYSR